MKKFTLGVIGNGFVGGAIVRGMKDYYDTAVYDVTESKSSDPFDEVVTRNIVFVCLPTPMFKDGFECDLSYINGFFDKVSESGIDTNNTSFVIKSTVPVGTTEGLNERFPSLKIVHSPEFLTAKHANIDFISPARNIVGGELLNGTISVAALYTERFPGTECKVMTSNESEFVKYAANTFFATKISFFNELYMLSDKMGLDWDNVLGGVMSDGRIGTSHFQVPGHDGDFGFGGICFPKDLNAFIDTFIEHGINPVVLKSVWERNVEVRKNKDWEKSKSAVS
jgi:UDPglucose 6-dehydrogenase